MINETLTRLKKAETYLGDNRNITHTNKYYRDKIRNINSELDELIQELETHV